MLWTPRARSAQMSRLVELRGAYAACGTEQRLDAEIVGEHILGIDIHEAAVGLGTIAVETFGVSMYCGVVPLGTQCPRSAAPAADNRSC